MLREERSVSFRLRIEAVAEAVTVVAETTSIISPSSTGPAANVAQEAIETLSTVARSKNEGQNRLGSSPTTSAVSNNPLAAAVSRHFPRVASRPSAIHQGAGAAGTDLGPDRADTSSGELE